MLLILGEAIILEKISNNTLKRYYQEGSFHLVHPPLEKVPISPFIKFICRGQQMHFQVILLHLLYLSMLC